MLRLKVLGSVSLEADGRPVTGRATQRRRLALLALLAAARERGVPRDRVLALLWPERDTETARHTLSQTLYAIRRDFAADAIIAGVDDLRLDASVITSDVAEFEQALADGNRDRALALYAGPFLDGFFVSDAPEFERWVDAERQRLAAAYGTALGALADEATARGDHTTAAAYWRKRAALEPLSGSVAVRLMTALAAAGDRASALQQARVHAELLRQEMDVGPDPEVTQLAKRLAAELTRHSPIAAARGEPAVASPIPHPRSRIPRQSWRRRAWITAGVAVLGIVGIASVIRPGPNPRPSVPARAVVLGSITSPDSSLALAVREALRAELESEGGVRVIGESQLRETMELMRLPASGAIEASLAVEIALRRGVPLAIAGAAVPVGTGVQLVARLLDARTGEPVATVSERPRTAEEVVPAVTRLAAALRRHALGAEPGAAAPPPLPPVTTGSLAALRNYAQARQALTRLDRPAAMALLEAAIAHDSLFALAHYLAGDVAWYVDEYSHAVAHLGTALRLAARLPARERLIVRARYEQVVRDRLDSALAYWQQLRVSYPDDLLGHEGVVWTYIGMERWEDVAAVTDTALRQGSTSPDLVRFHYTALIELGDTAGARRFARVHRGTSPNAELSVQLAVLDLRRAWEETLRLVDSASPPLAGGRPNPRVAPSRQWALLELGRLEEARREMEAVVERDWMQSAPRAMAFQAHADIGWRGPSEGARALVRRTLEWVQKADIYPPAVARLSELVATAAARLGDTTTIAAARALVRERNGGRRLPSLEAALLAIDACDAYARADWRRAADLAARSRPLRFHGRSVQPLTLLEADARAALGQRARADSLYRAVSERGTIWQPFAARALRPS